MEAGGQLDRVIPEEVLLGHQEALPDQIVLQEDLQVELGSLDLAVLVRGLTDSGTGDSRARTV